MGLAVSFLSEPSPYFLGCHAIALLAPLPGSASIFCCCFFLSVPLEDSQFKEALKVVGHWMLTADQL